MATVFRHYADPLARYLQGGFGFSSGSERVRFAGIRDRHELQDAVAETFRKAFEEGARLRYSGLSPYGAYLKTVARNLVLDRLKSSRSKRELLDDPTEGIADGVALDDSPMTAQPMPADRVVERSELAGLLSDYVTTLAPDMQRFVQLRYVEGHAQDSVAETLSVSRRWVRNAEVTVRRGLLRHLKGSGYLPKAASHALAKGGA